MKLSACRRILLGTSVVKKIYHGTALVYSWVSLAPAVSDDTMANAATADDYQEGATTWGDITLSAGCSLSEDGLEFQNEETYVSTIVDTFTYPFTFEFKGRIDSSCYKAQANGPGMLFGIGASRDGWGDGITCYATTDYGIILDTRTAMTVVTNVTPEYCHLVLTVDASAAITLYINGIGNTWTSTSADSAVTSSKSYIFNGEGVGRFAGAISRLRVWNSLLTADEIGKLFADDDSRYVS